jgi:membrane protease YdiL (CAAX protease family)
MKRVVAFPLVRLLLIVVTFAVLIAPVVLAINRAAAHPASANAARSVWTGIAISWAAALLLLAVLIVIERLTTGRPPRKIGFDPVYALRDLSLGVALGAALFSVVVLELAAGGHYRVTAIHLTPALAPAALLLLADAAAEELLFRGIVFRLIEEWAGTWIALAISAILFGAVHVANPGATWVSTLAIALEAGVLLAAAFVVTKNLWLPIGLHFAWNFFEGPIYGTQISGHAFLTSAIGAQLRGPALLTGGAFGPEAGLPATITCLVAAAVLLVYARRHSLIMSPQWVQRHAA